MPNFFKKLTGSLKMPESEEEIFEEEGEKENAPPEKSDNIGIEEEASIPSDEEELNQEMPVESYEQKNDNKEEESTPDEETSSQYEDSEAKPYTIAQLAQATTTRKKRPVLKSRLEKLTHFSKKDKGAEETEEKVESEPEGQLAIDVYETPSDIIIKSTIAGVDSKDLDIGIEENTVNIRGSRHSEQEAKGADYFYQECYWGTFSRSIILPVEVDTDKTEASLKNGVLTIKLPKIQREREKKIKIIG